MTLLLLGAYFALVCLDWFYCGFVADSLSNVLVSAGTALMLVCVFCLILVGGLMTFFDN